MFALLLEAVVFFLETPNIQPSDVISGIVLKVTFDLFAPMISQLDHHALFVRTSAVFLCNTRPPVKTDTTDSAVSATIGPRPSECLFGETGQGVAAVSGQIPGETPPGSRAAPA